MSQAHHRLAIQRYTKICTIHRVRWDKSAACQIFHRVVSLIFMDKITVENLFSRAVKRLDFGPDAINVRIP